MLLKYFFPFRSDADRAPQLKAGVRRFALQSGRKSEYLRIMKIVVIFLLLFSLLLASSFSTTDSAASLSAAKSEPALVDSFQNVPPDVEQRIRRIELRQPYLFAAEAMSPKPRNLSRCQFGRFTVRRMRR